jgi:hypothetical protein
LLGEPEAKTFAASFYTSEALKKLAAEELIFARRGHGEQYKLDINL